MWVGKRLIDILKHSESNKLWFYCPMGLNPADLVSRGLSSDLKESALWWQGPTFLCLPREDWPKQPDKFKEKKSEMELNDADLFCAAGPKVKRRDPWLEGICGRVEKYRTVIKAITFCLR
jgi:hypothetical protein